MSFDLAAEYEALGEDLLPPLLPDGVYTAEVISASGGVTSTGKECVKMVLRILDTAHAGRTQPTMLTWSPDNTTAREIFTRSMAILGLTPSWIKANAPVSMDKAAAAIIGAVVQINTKIKPYNGADQVNVNFKAPVSSPATSAAPAAAPPVLGAPAAAAPPWTPPAATPPAPPVAPPAAPQAAPAGFAWPGAPAQ